MVDGRGVSGEITLTGGGGSANIPDIPRPVLRALYHSIVNPQANLLLDYDKCKTVSANDIEQLVIRFIQWTSQYDVQATGTAISVKRLKKKGVHFNSTSTYKSIEEFLQQEPGQSAAVDSIGLRFSLLNENKDTGVIENLEVNVAIENLVGHQDNVYLRAFGGPRVRIRAPIMQPFKVSIGYTDYIVAKSFQAVFEDWMESLGEFEVASESRLLKEICHYDPLGIFSAGRQIVKIFPATLSVSVGFGLLDVWGDTVPEHYLFLCILLLSYFVGDTVIRLIANFSNHSEIPGPPFVDVNMGDGKKRAEYSEKVLRRRKSMKREAYAVLIAFAISISSGYFLSLLV